MQGDYDADEDEVSAVADALVGHREPGDDALAWGMHLKQRQTLLSAVSQRIADEYARTVSEMYHQRGGSYADLAERIGVSRARAQQYVERARQTPDTP